jgi:hypothetical protein
MHFCNPVCTFLKCCTCYYTDVHVIVTRSIFEIGVSDSYNARYIVLIGHALVTYVTNSLNARCIFAILFLPSVNVVRITIMLYMLL